MIGIDRSHLPLPLRHPSRRELTYPHLNISVRSTVVIFLGARTDG